MRTVKQILIIILVFFAGAFSKSGELLAHVEHTYYLHGKVGEREIAIKILCYDESPTRQLYYFFKDSKKDRFLSGKRSDNKWHFLPGAQQAKAIVNPEITLNIAEANNGIWTGTCTDSTGKTAGLVLQPIVADSLASSFSYLSFVKELDLYESYKLSSVVFTRTTSEMRTKDLWCDWYVERESGLSFFRLRSPKKKLNTANINAALETIHLSLLQKYFAFDHEKKLEKVETIFHYISNELVSFQVISTTILNSSKSQKSPARFTLDIQSGQPANLEEIVWFDSIASKPAMDDLFKIYKYRKNVFAPKVFNLLKNLYPGNMVSDSCNINKVDTWVLPAWVLTPKGIALTIDSPGKCNMLDWAIIPYKNIAPFLGRKYHLIKS
jgi:hypothetical protein